MKELVAIANTLLNIIIWFWLMITANWMVFGHFFSSRPPQSMVDTSIILCFITCAGVVIRRER